MDFAYSPRTRELQDKLSAFMQRHVYPAAVLVGVAQVPVILLSSWRHVGYSTSLALYELVASAALIAATDACFAVMIQQRRWRSRVLGALVVVLVLALSRTVASALIPELTLARFEGVLFGGGAAQRALALALLLGVLALRAWPPRLRSLRMSASGSVAR